MTGLPAREIPLLPFPTVADSAVPAHPEAGLGSVLAGARAVATSSWAALVARRPSITRSSIVAPASAAGGLLVAWVVYHRLVDVDTVATQPPFVAASSPSTDPLARVTALLLIVGSLVATFAVIHARRGLRLAAEAHRRSQVSSLNDRFSSAVERLGHGSAAVRLAGVYALARLADDWPHERQTCIDVLCAYARLPLDPDLDDGERQVRLAVMKVIRQRLDLSLPHHWCAAHFDFTGATIIGGDLSGGRLLGTLDFTGATIDGTLAMSGLHLEQARVRLVAVRLGDQGLVDLSQAVCRHTEIDATGLSLGHGSALDLRGAELTDSMIVLRHLEMVGGGIDAAEISLTNSFVEFEGMRCSDSRFTFSGGRIADDSFLSFRSTEIVDCRLHFDEMFIGTEAGVFFTPCVMEGSTVRFAHADIRGALAFTGGTVASTEIRFTDALRSTPETPLATMLNGGTIDFACASITDSHLDVDSIDYRSGTLIPPPDLDLTAGTQVPHVDRSLSLTVGGSRA